MFQSWLLSERRRPLCVLLAGATTVFGMSNLETDIVRELFVRAVPEIANGSVEIKAIAREAGYRSKVALQSKNSELDSVGICVGVRGIRIKKVVDALGGERIDLVRWNEDLKALIRNALQPAEVEAVVLDQTQRRATVFVGKDQKLLLLGRRGINLSFAQ